MAELTEIPLELQLKEANHQIKMHLSKGHKFQQFLSPMFLWHFPTIMENQISVDWNTVSGIFHRTPTLPITLIDTEILDDWFTRPSVWDVSSNLRDGLTFLKNAKEDSVVLVVTPAKPTYSPQPRKSKYLTLLPISSNPDVDRGPVHAFAATGLPVASKEGHGGDMPVHVKMPSCFGSSKQPKTELMWELALLRGLLWKSIHYVECNLSGELVKGSTGKPLCQELLIHLTGPSGKLEYMPTDRGHPPPLTLATYHPGWDDYLDLTEIVTEMAHRLMKEDGQQVVMPPKAGTTPKKKEVVKSVITLVDEGIGWVASDQFPSNQQPGASRDNPVHLSDATDASASGSHPRKDDDFDDEAKLLGHFSDALREMAASIVDLEDEYIKALHEVIMETERALRDVSRIDAYYVSQVVTVMSSWQEVVQTAASHMEGVDTTIYLVRLRDA